MTRENKNIISIESLFKKTFDMFGKGMESFISIQAIVFAATFGVVFLAIALIAIVVASDIFLMALVAEYEEIMATLIVTAIIIISTVGVLAFFITIILPYIFGQAALITASGDVERGFKRKITEYINLAWGRKWEIAGLFLLSTLITTVGFMFLVIPGIILGFFLTFAPFILILEKKKIAESISNSFSLVWNNFWGILLRLVVIYLALMFVTIFSSFIPMANIVINFMSSIFMVIYLYLLYKDIRQCN